MYGLGWHEVFQSASLRDMYSVRNSSATYSGMETKIVYAVGSVSMVFVAVYAIIICVVNTLRTNYRNCSVAPGVNNRNDVSHVRLNKDPHNLWQSLVVSEMHGSLAGSSRCDILSKQHRHMHKDIISDERSDGPARKQPVDCHLLCSGEGETTHNHSQQAYESFQRSTFREDQGSSLASSYEASPTMKVRQTSPFEEHLLAFPVSECFQVSHVKESLQPPVDKGLQTFAGVEVHQKHAAIEGQHTSSTIESLQTSATVEHQQKSASIEGYQTFASIEDHQTYACIKDLQISTVIENLKTIAALKGLQTAAAENLQIPQDRYLHKPASLEDLRTPKVIEDLPTSTAVEDLQTPVVIEDLPTFTAVEDLQTPVVIEDLPTFTAVEDLQTPAANKGLQTSKTTEEFQTSTSIEVFRLPPAIGDSTSLPAIDVPQISSNGRFPLTATGTNGPPLTPPVTKYLRTVVSNHGHDQGSQPRSLSKLWPRSMLPLPRPSSVFAISNNAPNSLHLAGASTDSDYNEPFFRLQNNVHII